MLLFSIVRISIDMGSNMGPKAAIVILNWNAGRTLLSGLESLYRISYPTTMLTVIDKTIGFAGRKIYCYDFQGNDNAINVAGMHLNLWIGTHQ
jgi:hypothetical protein